MRTQHRRVLVLAAAAALVSGTVLASAPGASALPLSVQSGQSTQDTQDTQGRNGPVTIGLAGVPGSVTAGAAPVEFTATLTNSADHEVTADTGFTIADGNSGIKETQLRLEYQVPGSTQWKSAPSRAGAGAGASWELDTSAGRLHLPAGASLTYRLRLAVTADANGGRASALFQAVVLDPTLPPEQRVFYAASPFGSDFTIVPAGGPTTPPAPALPDLGVDGLPAAFTAGGDAKPFRLTIANHSGRDIRFYPEVTFQGRNTLTSELVHLDFQTPEGVWLPATGYAQQEPGQLQLMLRADSKESTIINLHDGEARTVNVRLSFTAAAPVGTGSVLFTGSSLPLTPGGKEIRAAGPAAGFAVVAPGGAGTPSGPPSPEAPSTRATGPAASGPADSASPSTARVVPVSQATGQAPGQASGQASGQEPVRPAAPGPAPVPAPTSTLASTGGGSDTGPMAIGGAAAIVLGLGTIAVTLHRRRGARPSGR
ncbi:hypothetical protein [Kitasatospora sp. NPDC092286]|uniref:hypothetical protein n=1 Tax=Kitasatospora sp. NPDC092286 TaxID=3364087 RepID=UPI00380D85EC